MSQTTLTDVLPDAVESGPFYYRSIVKDGYATRDEHDDSDTRVEIAAWTVVEHEPEAKIKNDDGTLKYAKILDIALSDAGAEEISRRTGLKSYRDNRGGRGGDRRGPSNRPSNRRRD